MKCLFSKNVGVFLSIFIYFFFQECVSTIRTILAQPKTLGYHSFSKIFLVLCMMCVFCQLKFTGIVNHKDFLRRSSHMLCLGFLIFLLAAVTFSNTTELYFEFSDDDFSSRKQLNWNICGSILLETRKKSYNRENYLSPPTLPHPLHTNTKSLLKLPSTYNNAHYVIHRNICVLV